MCQYRGTLLDGTEFDSSYKRGQPATFPVTGVIKGWTEALQLMPVGSKWQLYIPADLAYGERGQGPIGPNAALIFDVETGLDSAEDSPSCRGGASGPGNAAPRRRLRRQRVRPQPRNRPHTRKSGCGLYTGSFLF